MKFKDLKLFEKLTIDFSMFLRRKYVKRNKLSKGLQKRLFCTFRENHIWYYLLLIRPGFSRNSVGLIISYAYLRSEENLRLLLLSKKHKNNFGFYSAIRSQLELQAFLDYCLRNEEYRKEFISKNEDRKSKGDPNVVKNIVTLIEQLAIHDDKIIPQYDYLSLILHPNPSSLFEVQNIRVLSPESGKTAHIVPIDMYFEHTWEVDKDVELDLDLWIRIMCARIHETQEITKEIAALGDERSSSFDFLQFIPIKNEIRKRCGFPYWKPKDDSGRSEDAASVVINPLKR